MAYIDYRYILPMAVLMGLQFFSDDLGAGVIGPFLTLSWVIILVLWARRLSSLLPKDTKPLLYLGHLLWGWFLAGILGALLYVGLLVSIRQLF